MKKRVILPAVVCVVLVVGMLTGCGASSGSGSSEKATADNVATKTDTSETANSGSKPTSSLKIGEIDGNPIASLADAKSFLRVTLDSCSYSFPCKVSDFTANGWTLNDSDDNANPNSTVVGGDNYLSKGEYGSTNFEQIWPILYNPSDKSAKWTDCTVTGLEIDSLNMDNAEAVAFSCASGLAWGQSHQDVEGLLGDFVCENNTEKSSGYRIYIQNPTQDNLASYVAYIGTTFDDSGNMSLLYVRANESKLDLIKG